MLETVVGALLPALMTVLLGYVAARHHDFGPKDAPILTRMVMTYALPLAIFVGTVSTTRGALVKELPLLIALSVTIIGLYCAVFLVCRFIFRFSLGVSVLSALAASAPDVPFFGPVVVSYLYGPVGSIPIAIGSIVINITVVPVTVILLSLYAGGGAGQPAGGRAQPAEMTSGPVVLPPAEVG